MFNFDSNPVVSLKDYTMTLTFKDEFLSLNGKFHLESNFLIPNEFIEISYLFPHQKVEKLFLKKNDDICYPSKPHLTCAVYENSAFIDSKYDSLFSQKRKNLSSINFQANFNINSSYLFKKHDLSNNIWKNSLSQSLSDIKLHNTFDWKNVFSVNSGESQNLEILDQVIFSSNKQPSYLYDSIKIYSDNFENSKFNVPVIYLKDISGKSNNNLISKDKVFGKMILSEKSTSKSYVLNIEQDDFVLEYFADNDYWKYELTPQFLQKVANKLNDFFEGKLDLEFEINRLFRKDFVNVTLNFTKNKQNTYKRDIVQGHSKIIIDPEGFSLNDVSFNEQWIKEELSNNQ